MHTGPLHPATSPHAAPDVARHVTTGLPSPTRVSARTKKAPGQWGRAGAWRGSPNPTFARFRPPVPASRARDASRSPPAMSGNRIGRGKGGAARPVATCMAAAIVCVVVLLVAASALLFLLSSSPPPATGVPGNGPPREPVELAIGLAGHERWLDALRAWAKLACFNLRRPPAEPR
jgi:hypothetical protein